MLYSCKSKLNILYHKFLGTSYAFFVCLWLDLISVANETMAAIQNRIVAIYQCEKKKCPTCKRLGTTSKLKESIKLGCWGMNFVKIWWATSIWSYSQILSVTTSIQWPFVGRSTLGQVYLDWIPLQESHSAALHWQNWENMGRIQAWNIMLRQPLQAVSWIHNLKLQKIIFNSE